MDSISSLIIISIRVFTVISIIIIGLLISVVYFFLQSTSNEDLTAAVEGLVDENNGPRMPGYPERMHLELEYETLNRNVEERGKQTLTTGSIVLAASFLVMGEAFSLSVKDILLLPIIVIISVLLFGSWLLFYATTKRLDDICYERMRCIEAFYGTRVHRLLWDRARGAPWYQFGRLLTWQLPFWILIIFGVGILIVHL